MWRILLVYGNMCSGNMSDLNTPAALSYKDTASLPPNHILSLESTFTVNIDLLEREEFRLSYTMYLSVDGSYIYTPLEALIQNFPSLSCSHSVNEFSIKQSSCLKKESLPVSGFRRYRPPP